MNGAEARPSTLPWPPVIYLSAIAIAIILDYLLPLPWITEPLSDMLFIVGILLVLAAIAMEWTAIRTLKRNKTTIRPDRPSEHLVIDGPFGITRNPIYLGNSLLMIGIGLIIGSLWFLILSVVAGFITQKAAIEGEERHLDIRFGKRYRDYKQRVRRWL
ncbi:MAG TPA: isoprenylcysteine carboxylmethyltransferase family protein [Rhizobiaceae bacterium]|nr:isoprenylcysteine carboxylmethyltransferase family protein [Rhizobiaceae bacterium]